ncbi:hypothetical protein FALCPG4_015575 [Fusarium falciforme]
MNEPTTKPLSAFIEGWLDTVTHPLPKSGLVTAHHDAIASSDPYHPRLNWDEMPTPPASSSTPTRGHRRSPKRPRHEISTTSQFDHGFTDDSPFDDKDNDKTPSASSQSHSLGAMSLPARPLLQNTPSLSSASSTRSSNARSTSPVKRSTLQLLKKPVHYVSIADDPTTQLSENILPTYDRIIDISNHENFLPRAVEEELRTTHRGVRERWFFDDDDLSSNHVHDFAVLREIKQAAEACWAQGASEAAWNVDVHGPLLKLALAPFPSLSRDILTHARISKLFVPEMKASSHYDFTRSKMIDWGIRVRPPPSTFSRIQALVDELPDNQSSVNQTVYGPVRYEPIAISIESKIAIGALEEARLQLGVWVAAWHRRMSALLPANQEPIITLPLILIMEHEWYLLFACDRRDRIDIVEHVAMGDTRGLIGLYKILATLRSLASWMQNEYTAWMQQVFHE